MGVGALLLSAVATPLVQSPAAAHDEVSGWVITGGADQTCIKSRGGYENHDEAFFSVRFEHVLSLPYSPVCTTERRERYYHLTGRGYGPDSGNLCWGIVPVVGTAGQASVSVWVDGTCGMGYYDFETHGRMEGTNGDLYGTPLLWGGHYINSVPATRK